MNPGLVLAEYNVYSFDSIDDVFACFPEGSDSVDETKLLFTGTVSTRGIYTQVDALTFPNRDMDRLSIVIFHPRIVLLKVGEVWVTRQQAEQVLELQKASARVISKVWGRE